MVYVDFWDPPGRIFNDILLLLVSNCCQCVCGIDEKHQKSQNTLENLKKRKFQKSKCFKNSNFHLVLCIRSIIHISTISIILLENFENSKHFQKLNFLFCVMYTFHNSYFYNFYNFYNFIYLYISMYLYFYIFIYLYIYLVY